MGKKSYELYNGRLFAKLNKEEQELVKNLHYHETMGRADPVYFAENHLGLTLHKNQKNYLRETDPVWIENNPEYVEEYNKTHKDQIRTGHKNILNPSNRWGKTVVIAIKHIRHNYYKFGVGGSASVWEDTRYQTLGLSPHSAQIEACYNYILDILHNRFAVIPYGEDGEPDVTLPKKSNKCQIDFYVSHNTQRREIKFKGNAAFFGATTGDDQGSGIQGRPFGYISYDECVLSHHLREELFGRIFSRTMDWNAPIDLVSTADDNAKGQQYYYHLVRNADKGENEWYIKHGILDDNTFIDPKLREAAKAKLLAEDPIKYRQVVLGQFVPSGTKAFDIDTVENMWDKKIPKPLRKDLPYPAHADHLYVGSVDWGFADTGDPTIIKFFDIFTKPYQLVYSLKIQGGNPVACLGTLKALYEHYMKPKIIMDTSALGGTIIKKMLRDMDVKTYDFTGHGGDKADAMFRLKLLLSKDRKPRFEKDKIIEENPNYGGLKSYYIPEMEDQLAAYELEDKKLEQDHVIVLMQFAWFMHKQGKITEPKTYHILRGNKISALKTPTYGYPTPKGQPVNQPSS